MDIWSWIFGVGYSKSDSRSRIFKVGYSEPEKKRNITMKDPVRPHTAHFIFRGWKEEESSDEAGL